VWAEAESDDQARRLVDEWATNVREILQ